MSRTKHWSKVRAAHELKARGLHVTAIASALGTDEYRVRQHLRQAPVSAAACCACAADLPSKELTAHDGQLLCADCVRLVPAEFPAMLRTLRRSRGWTQHRLDARAKLPLGSVAQMELGARVPSWTHAAKLLRALGIRLELPASRGA